MTRAPEPRLDVRPLPDFIIGGAARSGTTWTYELLGRHPQVFMAGPRTPEPKFFWDDAQYEKGIAWYRSRWFADVPPGRLAGEKSTAYLEGGRRVAERIRTHLPAVRLIFVLRNPVDRAYSNYLWSRMHGWEKLGFEEAIDREPQRLASLEGALRVVRPFAYLARSDYAALLRPFYEVFAREQILCLPFEHIVTAPRDFAAEVHGFLGVAARPRDADALMAVNASDRAEHPLPPGLRARMRGYVRSVREGVEQLVGRSFGAWEAEPAGGGPR